MKDADAVDRVRLRIGRRERLQQTMRAQGVEACLLFNDPNVRYAVGASAMPIWSNTTFVRCALVPAEGRPILFDYPNAAHLFRGIEAEVRPMVAWEFYDDTESRARVFAGEIAAALRDLGVSSRRLAVDRLGTPGFLALQKEGIAIVDSAPVTTVAREIKTPEELALFALGGEIVMEMLGNFERSLTPGVRERELLAVLSETLLRRGGEHLATSTVCSGPNTNPWRAEATARVVENGDLVYVDTDAVAVEGYFFCVSRAFRLRRPAADPRAAGGVPRRARLAERAAGVDPPRPDLPRPRRQSAAPSGEVHAATLRSHDPQHRARGREPERRLPRRPAAQWGPRDHGEHGSRRGALLRRGRRKRRRQAGRPARRDGPGRAQPRTVPVLQHTARVKPVASAPSAPPTG